MRAREEKEKGRGKDGATRLTPRLAHPSPCRAEFAGQRAAQGGRVRPGARAPRVTGRRTSGGRGGRHSGSRAAWGHDECGASGAGGGGGRVGVRLYMRWAAFQPNKYDRLRVKREKTCVCI